MSYQTCWRCLSRPPIRKPFVHPSASFSTSTPLRVLPPKKHKPANSTPQKGRPATFIKKSKKLSPESRHKKPAPGERLALRKRIVLSNNNALPVADLEDFGVESIGVHELRGQVRGLSFTIIDRLRAVDAFKRTQSWGLFRKPAMLIRWETTEYGELIEEMSGTQQPRRNIRRVLVGERGSGKSLILLQAMTMAFLKDWVVINLPEAQDLVIGHTEYGPIPHSSPPLYHQTVYTASLLSAITRANPILSTLTLQSPPPAISLQIQPSINLAQFALLGAANPEIAPVIFQTLVQDLLLPSRPPLLLCIDGLSHVMKYSAYRNAAFELIHAHDLALVKWFMSHLSGASPLPNGGMVLAATSGSNSSFNPSLDIAIREVEYPSRSGPAVLYPETAQSTFALNPNCRNPFIKYDQRVLDVFSRPGIDIQRIKGLPKEGAQSLMEYWAKSGLMRQKVDPTLVGEKWALSGGGVVGELERATVRMKL